jgi:hypothetical protein
MPWLTHYHALMFQQLLTYVTLAEPLTVHFPPAFTASLLNNDPAQAKLLWSGLAKATRSNYFGAVTNYEEIRKQDGLADWPAASESLANFVTSRAYPNNTTLRAQLRPTTLRSYLSALRSYHIDHQLSIEVFDNNAFVSRLISGAERLFPWSKKTRLPLTQDILWLMLEPWKASQELDKVNLCAAWSMGYAGFLRMGEFTYKNEPRDIQTARSLTRADVTFAEDDSLLHNHASAEQNPPPLRRRQYPHCCRGAALTRTVHAQALQHGPTTQACTTIWLLGEPQFSHTAVTSRMPLRLRELGLAESDYSGHSFRKGATTDAMNNGIPEHDVRIMGRWKSDSVKLYYKLDPGACTP